MAIPVGPKQIKQAGIAIVFLAITLTFIPLITVFYIGCGLIDVMRNDKRDYTLFQRYFTGNGFTTWLVSPINLIFDLLCKRNPGIYTLEDFSPDARQEVEAVLTVFRDNKDAILARIDRDMGDAKRAMFLYRWFGLRYNQEIPELNGAFRHVRTIAVSVFDGKERTSFHFGPHRLTVRVLLNLTPVPDEEVFIEVGNTRHYWRDDPLFIFDDTLFHRSINDHDGRRYVVFLDVMRPSPVPAITQALVLPISLIARAAKDIYYRRWKLLGV